MKYNIKDHIHLYSSWAASRASSVKNNRFTVQNGQAILNQSTIKSFIQNPDGLPTSDKYDQVHCLWRNELIGISQNILSKPFTHGVAAKMINIYLKSVIICGGYYNHEKAKEVHPPIDSVLLKELASKNFNGKAKFWRKANKIAWSNFTSEEYQNVINEIRLGLEGKALWRIEEYWKGYR